jgi:hypothetical protein
MGKQGDAYPDPREMRSGNSAKMVLCIGLILICLGSSIAMVAAPGVLPDPNCYPDPVFGEYPCNGLPVRTPIVGSRPIFIM